MWILINLMFQNPLTSPKKSEWHSGQLHPPSQPRCVGEYCTWAGWQTTKSRYKHFINSHFNLTGNGGKFYFSLWRPVSLTKAVFLPQVYVAGKLAKHGPLKEKPSINLRIRRVPRESSRKWTSMFPSYQHCRLLCAPTKPVMSSKGIVEADLGAQVSLKYSHKSMFTLVHH